MVINILPAAFFLFLPVIQVAVLSRCDSLSLFSSLSDLESVVRIGVINLPKHKEFY